MGSCSNQLILHSYLLGSAFLPVWLWSNGDFKTYCLRSHACTGASISMDLLDINILEWSSWHFDHFTSDKVFCISSVNYFGHLLSGSQFVSLWYNSRLQTHYEQWSWGHHWKMPDTWHNAMNVCVKKQKLRCPRVILLIFDYWKLCLWILVSHSPNWNQFVDLQLICLCILSVLCRDDNFYWPAILQQAAEVGRRQFRNKEVGGNVDNTLKLQTAEQKMGELTSAMAVLGKEAAAAMTAVEAQQQRLTLQRLIAMVSLLGQ